MAAGNPKPEPERDYAHVPLTEEFDDAKHNLPAAGPVIIALVIVAVVIAGAALLLKQPPAARGSIGDPFAAEVPNQNQILVSVPLTIENTTKKPLTIRDISVTLKTDQGDLTDTAAAGSDFPQYFAALPDLQSHTQQPLARELKIAPQSKAQGSVIVAFPVDKAKFDARKGLTATVQLYDYSDLKIEK